MDLIEENSFQGAVPIIGRSQLTGQELDIFHRDGFVDLGQRFSIEEAAALVLEFERVMTLLPDEAKVIEEDESANVRSLMGWENASPMLTQFARDARVLDAVRSVLGEAIVFHQTKCNPKAPQGLGDRWDAHRDIAFWHFLDGVPDPCGIVSVFIALTEQTETNGAAYTWVGAHNVSLRQLLDEAEFGDRQEGKYEGDTAANLSIQIKQSFLAEYERAYQRKALVGPPGSVWLLDSRNLHASRPNESNQTRILVANVFRRTSNVPKHPRQDGALCSYWSEPLITN
ncbi:phytanoyl-CoA dioxygenase family protein [Sphingobium sp. R-21]|uniref:phytanoyl-CoA dioxygenase family protein n=1 Tax=Sphingobium sp. R-21 TaxID=3404056 RepID=UPI003CF076E6